jgi:uncharacterized protein (DUF1778 family)/GNAT superfamily N-acetyltransferase
MCDAPLNVPASPEQRDLIDAAARLLGKTSSEFMLEAACERAKTIVTSHGLGLDESKIRQLAALLDAPQSANSGMERLMAVKAPWGIESSGGRISAPKSLGPMHRLDDFNCGEPSLDNWLKLRAPTNHLNQASRTFVVVDPDQRVLGYYALAAISLGHQNAASAVPCNMPNPLLMMILAKLAVDTRAQNIKLGAALLRDAAMRVRSVAEAIGVRALIVPASNERAKRFYEHHGFQISSVSPMTLMLSMNNFSDSADSDASVHTDSSGGLDPDTFLDLVYDLIEYALAP